MLAERVYVLSSGGAESERLSSVERAEDLAIPDSLAIASDEQPGKTTQMPACALDSGTSTQLCHRPTIVNYSESASAGVQLPPGKVVEAAVPPHAG